MQDQMIGMTNRNSIKESNATCIRPVHCRGMQTHSVMFNVCVPPVCSSYMFFSFDPSSQNCVLSSTFHALAGVALAIFLLLELGLNEISLFFTQRIQGKHQNYSRNNQNNNQRNTRGGTRPRS